MPSREELMEALAVMRPWLEEEALSAKLMVAEKFTPQMTMPEIAELVGVARALEDVPAILERRIRARIE